MSAAAATADAPAPKGKKKLLIIIIAAVVVLALAGVGAVLMLKKSPAEHEDADDGHAKPAVAKARDPKAAPVFAPLEPFTVNLADKEAERYAQVGITLELVDSSTEGALKTFMPAVRNNILMLLAHKTAGELMEREGKRRLAQEIRVETGRALGMPATNESVDPAADGGRRAPARKPEPALPVRAVHFATFIIQ